LARIFGGKLRLSGIFREAIMPNSEANDPRAMEIAKTVTLTEKDIKDAARLFRLLTDPVLVASALPDFSFAAPGTTEREILISRARIVLNARRLRERHFNRVMFGEPAWDILLMLYASDQSPGRLTLSRLAEWIETPLTTVVRWVNFLEEEHLVERQAHPTDRRTVFIKLRETGRAALDAYLGTIPG
jgi:DNA-binding MarR family transcriptional regulator